MESIIQTHKQFGLLTDWFTFVLDNISDEDGKKTIADHTNSLEWIAGHLIVGRYRNLVRLGMPAEPYQHLDKYANIALPPPNAIAFSRDIQYPSLTESRKQWLDYSSILLNTLENPDPAVLANELPFTALTGGNTVEDVLAFGIMHESYHIGQMSIIRKALGYPAMQLARRNP